MVTTDEAAPVVEQPVLAPGAVIAGRYRIEARLGAGGGGTVFRCSDRELGQTVALKVVSSDGDLERWRREVAMARQITDRNVCRVHDLGETDELRFVTMELVEGTSLRDKLRGDLSTADARSVIEQLIDGVAAIHAAGIVHRDLKPENVVVTPDGRAVIVDFGIAKPPRAPGSSSTSVATDRSEAVTRQLGSETPRVETPVGATITRAGFAIGTPRYMSPEQANAEPVDARTDIWALGLVAHELLTGALPEGEVAASIDHKWPGFAAVLRRCVALDAKDRFADARALKAALPATKPSKLPAVIALVGALGLIGFLVVKVVRGNGDDAPATPADTSRTMLQVTTTLDKQWPKLSPVSVALDATATQLAYTTGGGGVYVRPLAGGAVVEWPAPMIAETSTPRSLAAPRVIGWFSDGSLAIVGSTSNTQRLVRLRSTGAVESLVSEGARFHAAVSRTDKIAIASGRTIRELGGGEVATLPERSRVVALAWVGDKLAWLRVTGDELTLELAGIELWHGASELVIDPLLAAAGDGVMFSFRQRGETTIARTDTAKQLTVVETTPAHVGEGSIAQGALVVVRGTAREVIQLRDRFGNRTTLAHAPTSRGTHVAGWTTSGSLVMRVDDRVTTGTAATTNAVTKSWRLAAWEGTTASDLPAAVIGDDVLVRHADGDAWAIDRITPAGARTPFARIPNASAFHCVPDWCVVQQRDGDDAIWSELGEVPNATPTHAIKRQLHRRKVTGTPDFALPYDTGSLVIVTDGELIAVDRATGNPIAAPPPAALPTRWAAIQFDAEGQLWAAAESLEVLPFGLVRYRRRADAYGRPSSLVTEKDDVLRLFRTPFPSGSERDMKIAVPTLELALEIWRADVPR